MSSRCDVIIPVKNAPWWLGACLDALARNSAPEHLGRILVVDDGSTPDAWWAIERICSRHGVELMRNTGRPGFGGTCNFGAERSDAPFLLFLNTDCLVSPGTIRKLVAVCEADRTIGLACPLSNNSPVLTLPLIRGFSYEEMDGLLARTGAGLSLAEIAPDACTVVGNCLLITRACWERVGAFDPVWGAGYGEETDYQMRAMGHGFRGVALTTAYVFHFGNASFRYEAGMKELQQKNYRMFLTRWGDTFRNYAQRCATSDPVSIAAARLETLGAVPAPDLLFVLPILSQTIGGVHAVIDICNELLTSGVQARCALLGRISPEALREFREPIYFGLLHYEDERALQIATDVRPRAVAATLFSTTPSAWCFARARGIPLINFVQGYEVFFENGSRRAEVIRSLSLADENVVTSRWLADGMARLDPRRRSVHLPIGINEYVFWPGPRQAVATGPVRLGLALRSAPDKGQWILLEVLHQLAARREELSLTVFCAEGYHLPDEWVNHPGTVAVRMPADRGSIADELRRCDVFVDASLHEGFGLMPLEALACGAAVVASDSGGIREFLKHGECGSLVEQVNKPERYVEAILALLDDREQLGRMQARAVEVGRSFSASTRLGAYAAYFRELGARAGVRERCLLQLSDEKGFEGLEPGRHVVVSRVPVPPSKALNGLDRLLAAGKAGVPAWVKTARVKNAIRSGRRAAERIVASVRRPRVLTNGAAPDLSTPGPLVLHASDGDPSVLLPLFDYPAGEELHLLVDIDSPAETQLALYYSTSTGRGYDESRTIRNPLRRGRNVAILTFNSKGLEGRLRLDPGEVRGSYQIHRIEIRRTLHSDA